jgi:hypothetical protein
VGKTGFVDLVDFSSNVLGRDEWKTRKLTIKQGRWARKRNAEERIARTMHTRVNV